MGLSSFNFNNKLQISGTWGTKCRRLETQTAPLRLWIGQGPLFHFWCVHTYLLHISGTSDLIGKDFRGHEKQNIIDWHVMSCEMMDGEVVILHDKKGGWILIIASSHNRHIPCVADNIRLAFSNTAQVHT